MMRLRVQAVGFLEAVRNWPELVSNLAPAIAAEKPARQ
jgi:hypothetical protein